MAGRESSGTGASGPAAAGVDRLLRAYTPFRRMTVPAIYDLVATNGFTTHGLYLNLGYWKDARTIDEACPAMATLVADAAGMKPDDEVLDVGFGFADQDFLWIERFAPRRIIGLNVTRSQIRLANARVRRLGLTDRIDLREGSATDMPIPDASVDVVTAVECAFHFDTRERFFAEAMRVLRPGGRLVLADVIRNMPRTRRLGRFADDFNWTMFAQKLAVPPANADRRDTYAGKLRTSGFRSVDVASIRDDVFPGWHRALKEDAALLKRIPLGGRLPYRALLRFDANLVYGALDYVIASARKPS